MSYGIRKAQAEASQAEEVIVSVPHTGTRTLKAITRYMHMHSYEYMTPQDVVNRNADEVLVSPLRDPRDVWVTWYQRYSGRGYLMDPDHPKSFESAWRGMAALDRFFEFVYVPVDVPEREVQLRVLSERMGMELQTDWEPVGARKAYRKCLEAPEKDLGWIYELPFVKRFYARR